MPGNVVPLIGLVCPPHETCLPLSPFTEAPGAYIAVGALVLVALALVVWLLARRARGQRGAGGSAVTFVPGDIGLVVQHPGTQSASQVVAQLLTMPAVAADQRLSVALRTAARVTLLSQTAASALSLVVAHVPEDGARLVKRIRALNQRASRPNGSGAAPDFHIVGAVPNWLTSGAEQGTGLGGPGGMPVALAYPPAATDWQFHLPPELTAVLGQGGDGTGVQVAILDTAPDEVDLRRAYATWGGTNRLMDSLLGPDGHLEVHYAGNEHLLQMVDYRLDAHSYPMPDHGLFVAGIVHSIAPKATIHLIEALNPFGVGTFETFAAAFQAARLLAQGRPVGDVPGSVVVSPGGTAAPANGKGEPADTTESAAGARPLAMVVNYSWVFATPTNSATSHEIVALTAIWQALDPPAHVAMVGAAGNDGRGQAEAARPPARYPAAFGSVVGVGALDASGGLAPYSDKDDQPESAGFWTFGGGVAPTRNSSGAYVADAQKGMLGLYAGTWLPDGTPNVHGCVRWAGTSFSAPVITASLALVLSQTPGPIDDAAIKAALQQLRMPAATVGTEPVFPVTQG